MGRPSLYPWVEWMDGSAWRITRGEDFEIAPKSMSAALYAHAARQGSAVRVRIDGDEVEFQFTPAESVAA